MRQTERIIISLLVISAVAGGFWMFKSTTTTTTTTTDYPLINKSVTSGLGKHFIINFKPLKMSLESIQKSYPQKTYIYFAYINNGSWIGLNEKDEFVAASTIKVPVAMSLLKAVEDGKLKLTDSYSLEELDLDKNFGDLYKVGADNEFTVEKLLEIMLEKSDNTALNALVSIFHRIGIDNPLGPVYEFLGWESFPIAPEIGQTPNYSKITLKSLASIFIALYDARYVSVEHSQKILEYLTNTPFNDRIDAGVPDDVAVAHKIGTATLDETFSDCGIVYAPNRNYLLCLGSNGGDERRAAKFMAEVSSTVYKYVINN